MSQIANFYLVKDGQKKELFDGGCSGEIYMAIWDYFEGELDIDGRFAAPETEDILDCVKFDSETAEELLTAFDRQNLNELAAEVASDWDLPAQEVLKGFETILSHLKQVNGNGFLLYEMV